MGGGPPYNRPMIRIRTLSFVFVLTTLSLTYAPNIGAAERGEAGLPLPRFVSLRAEEVNLRTGPGVQYPVDWVYHRQTLPVQIIAEFENWRKIRDWEGTQGWMHQSMLTGRRTVVISGATHALRRKPHAKSAPVAMAEAHVIGSLLTCPEGSSWCKVDVDGYVGWLRHVDFWGTFPGEAVK